jgi:soluble lytic murein transglycosylase-like protein
MLYGKFECGIVIAAAAILAAGAPAYGGEQLTLATGFAMECVSHEALGDRIRCYSAAPVAGAERNYVDVAASAVVRVEEVPDPPAAPVAAKTEPTPAIVGQPTATELKQMLTRAGEQHNIDAELLASVVHAESGGHVQAVSRTGARGLMQLMPGTAQALGVKDAFAADQNVEGGTRYLDAMLTRYHDNIALALAAYNAGPGAVDRYHGVPPFRETRAYVASVIREFNRRKTALLVQAK